MYLIQVMNFRANGKKDKFCDSVVPSLTIYLYSKEPDKRLVYSHSDGSSSSSFISFSHLRTIKLSLSGDYPDFRELVMKSTGFGSKFVWQM